MHLRVSDLSAYLALGETMDQPQAEHLTLQLREHGPVGRERVSLFGKLEPVVLATQHLRERAALFVLVCDRGVERRELVILGGLDCLYCLLNRAVHRVGEFVHGRGTPELSG